MSYGICLYKREPMILDKGIGMIVNTLLINPGIADAC